MRRENMGRGLEEVSEAYLDQAAWMARVFARIGISFAVILAIVTVLVITNMADSGFGAFEVLIASTMTIAAVALVVLSTWLAWKARILATALEDHLSRKRSEH